jgi:hypothetical protein
MDQHVVGDLPAPDIVAHALVDQDLPFRAGEREQRQERNQILPLFFNGARLRRLVVGMIPVDAVGDVVGADFASLTQQLLDPTHQPDLVPYGFLAQRFA